MGRMFKGRALDAKELDTALATFPALRLQDILIYDGDCRFCIAQVTRLKKWAGTRLSPIPLQQPGLLLALGIDEAEAMRAMHLVTAIEGPKEFGKSGGRIYRGLEALVQALRHRPILGWLARLYYVPGFRQLGDLGYRLVARYRYAIMGRAIAHGECDTTCALHAHPGKR